MKIGISLKAMWLTLVLISIVTAIRAQQTGVFESTITYGGKKHIVAFSVPLNYTASNKCPLIIGLHGCPQPATAFRNGLKDFSTFYNAIVVCPDNFGDQITDGNFVLRTIDSTLSEYSIDTTMVFLTGFSCGGQSAITLGLNHLYKFRGVFPWEPYDGSVDLNTYDNEMPIVLAFGDKDASFDNDLILYDSLLANHSPVDMVVAQGVSHQIPASMNEIMFKSYRYLLDSNTISLSRISTVIIDSKTPEFKVTVRNIRDKQDRALEVSAYSATPSLIGNPTVDYVAGSDSAVLTMKPVGTITTTSYTKIVVEVKEINGTAIEQTVFDVKVKVKPRYPVKASSQYTFLTGPENAIDGIYKTKWTTQQADSQWICVDLCRNISVNGVIILWAQAAKEYKITVSTDSITWNEVYSNFMGIGGRDTISFEPVKSRYIQLDCIKRVSNAFRITEIEIDTGQFTGIKNILLNNDQGRLSLFPNVLSASDCRTTLSYSLQKPTQVNLSVYNVQGQKLRTFVNDFQQSGDYSIDFEIADDQKNQFTSGMYLFVISTPEFRDQKKMMIIR